MSCRISHNVQCLLLLTLLLLVKLVLSRLFSTGSFSERHHLPPLLLAYTFRYELYTHRTVAWRSYSHGQHYSVVRRPVGTLADLLQLTRAPFLFELQLAV